ncbi:MAG: ABC-F family ATP-binding cassette domain-containing protein [Leptospiraceae bacterium]|nr:ABC-F family ATP-binding cassette domain-containing protein [Leptospiraceae bacterium]MCK6381828.1 ABC-F family ATP-binding cassette domain-containing protein [Leptospiraceae bacterium]
MNLLSINKISKKSGETELFRELTFGLNEGEKVGIIGVNGSGKSTFLRMILGVEEVDNGEIFRNRNLSISYLEQNPTFNPEDSILGHIYKGKSQALGLVKQYMEICERMEVDSSEALEKEMHKIMEKMDSHNAWQYENRITSILQELGIKGLNRKMSELSGGMLKKVELVQTLIDDSNLLILDEPTNHLDIETILWLESFLIKTDKALLIVTHDRYFLDLVVDKIFEISIPDSILFEGNYDYYLEKKVEIEDANLRKEAKRISFLRVELEWLKRQPKARGTKQKARTDKIISAMNTERFSVQENYSFQVDPKKVGKKILEVSNISKSFDGNKLINSFSYTFKHYEKLGIIGPNGVGKSTFLNILSGRVHSDFGSVSLGVNTHIGYFDQTSIELPLYMRVLEYIQKNVGEYISLENGEKLSASKLLERFQFSSKLQSSLIEKLSGGEKRRLYLVQILMHNPNFLILDEPTNDFDIRTLSILEEFLMGFSGCVVTVSHDRYFMDRVADHLLVFDGQGGIHTFTGTYSEYLAQKKSNNQEKSKPSNENGYSFGKEGIKKKNLAKTQKEIQNVESEIEKLENQKKIIHEDMAKHRTDFLKVKDLNEDLKKLDETLLLKLNRWEELNHSVIQ